MPSVRFSLPVLTCRARNLPLPKMLDCEIDPGEDHLFGTRVAGTDRDVAGRLLGHIDVHVDLIDGPGTGGVSTLTSPK
jgi:hypothetical protein